jgi:hypothetical protein
LNSDELIFGSVEERKNEREREKKINKREQERRKQKPNEERTEHLRWPRTEEKHYHGTT